MVGGKVFAFSRKTLKIGSIYSPFCFRTSNWARGTKLDLTSTNVDQQELRRFIQDIFVIYSKESGNNEIYRAYSDYINTFTKNVDLTMKEQMDSLHKSIDKTIADINNQIKAINDGIIKQANDQWQTFGESLKEDWLKAGKLVQRNDYSDGSGSGSPWNSTANWMTSEPKLTQWWTQSGDKGQFGAGHQAWEVTYTNAYGNKVTSTSTYRPTTADISQGKLDAALTTAFSNNNPLTNPVIPEIKIDIPVFIPIMTY